MKKKLLALGLVMTLAVSTLMGCSSKSNSTETGDTASVESTEAKDTEADASSSQGAMYDEKTIIGQSSWIGFAPLYLADKKGFFDKYGADVEIQYFESKTDSKSALAAGRIQGMSTTVDTHVMSAASGLDISMVMAMDTSCGGDGISAKSDIKDVKSLAGRKVALDTSGGASYFWFQYLLQKEGMTLDDVEAVNMSSGDAGAAFVAGEVDAAVTWEPWLSKAKATEGGAVLIDSSETPGVIVDALAMDKDFIAKYPGTIKAIISGWYDALDYIKSNPEDAYAIMAEYTGNASGDELKAAMESEVQLYDEAGNIEYFKADINTIAQTASDLWLDMGLIEEAPDMTTLVDGNYLERLTK